MTDEGDPCNPLCPALAGLTSAQVTVTGTGKVSYVPDMAHVSVGVVSEGKTATEAWDSNRAIVKKLFDALKQHGTAAKDMKTTGLNISPRYVYPRNEEPRLVGYTVSYELNVTVRNLKELPGVLDDLVSQGANRNMNISWDSSDPEKLLDQARRRAVAEARKKAELYVQGAGASLGVLKSISESSAVPRPIYAFERTAVAGNAALPIAAGEQEMSATVTLTYAINNGPSTSQPSREPAQRK